MSGRGGYHRPGQPARTDSDKAGGRGDGLPVGMRIVRRLLAGFGALMAATFLMSPARAEFEIPQVDLEKIEIKYRGASHQGMPQPDDDGEIEVLRQSHELEFQYGLTGFWAVRLTPSVEEPAEGTLELATVGIETQVVLVPRKGETFGLAAMAGYAPVSWFVDLEDPDEFEFGPIMELAHGGWLLTLNPRLVDQLGRHAETDNLGLEYASQLEYRFAERWSVAALAFGEIDDLGATGPFDAKVHLLGPSLYLYSPDHHDRPRNRSGLAPEEWALCAGVLFGLTDASADATVRVMFAMEY